MISSFSYRFVSPSLPSSMHTSGSSSSSSPAPAALPNVSLNTALSSFSFSMVCDDMFKWNCQSVPRRTLGVPKVKVCRRFTKLFLDPCHTVEYISAMPSVMPAPVSATSNFFPVVLWYAACSKTYLDRDNTISNSVGSSPRIPDNCSSSSSVKIFTAFASPNFAIILASTFGNRFWSSLFVRATASFSRLVSENIPVFRVQFLLGGGEDLL
mmetsp:Transcript_28627/g.50406  ORF Transcript_28627/g.50406 Transcript_28627/m.50406 type:complete len:211 (+) Transcript_28627:235-867(+)